MTLQDTQRLINWYVEIDRTTAAKEPLALLGCPGLNTVATTQVGAVRGFWPLPGGTQALVAAANTIYLMTITVAATQNTIPQFGIVALGTIGTNTGPVVMRDNGVLTAGQGGYVFIVDGSTSCYYYRIAGAGTYSFTGGLSTSSPTIALGNAVPPNALPPGLIVGAAVTLTDTGGLIPASTTISSIDYNTPAIGMSANSTGTNPSTTITLTIPQFGLITDPGFLGADRIAFIEGWLVFNYPGTRTFYTTGPVAYSNTFPGSFYALKDSSTDNLITLYENNRELWLIGERTSEVWYNAGNANFAFDRIPGVGPQIGCAAKHSIHRAGSQLVWLGKNEQGENVIIATNQYSWTRLSTHAVEHAISGYPLVSDCIGYAYIEEGHLFSVLTFPTADVTWVYDFASELWHQRASYDPVAGVFHRHKGNAYMDFGDVRIVGDYSNGNIYQMSRQFYTDAGGVIRAVRRTPHVWSRGNRERLFFSQLQVEFTPGVGLQVGQGSNPQVMLRWSDDGGFTWSNEHWTTIGKAGQTKNRAIWRALGTARDRVWEVTYTDPTARDIIGSTLFAEASG